MKSAVVCLMVFATVGVKGQSADDLAAARRLLGMWRLVDRTVTFADGTSRPARGPRRTSCIPTPG